MIQILRLSQQSWIQKKSHRETAEFCRLVYDGKTTITRQYFCFFNITRWSDAGQTFNQAADVSATSGQLGLHLGLARPKRRGYVDLGCCLSNRDPCKVVANNRNGSRTFDILLFAEARWATTNGRRRKPCGEYTMVVGVIPS